MDEEERLELERLRLGAAGQRASDDYEAMVNAPTNKVNIPSFGQPAPGIIPAAPAMPSILGATPAMQPLPTADEVALPQQGVVLSSDPGSVFPTPIADSVGQSQSGLFATGVNPMMEQQSLTPSEPAFAPTPVTNVGLMGEPLREQPSVEQIRFDSRPDRLASKDLAVRDEGLLKGLARVFTDPLGSKMRAERYGVPQPAESQVRMDNPMMQQQPIMSPTPMLDSVLNSGIGPFQPGAVDFSNPPTTAPMGEPIALDPITRTPIATFSRTAGGMGEIYEERPVRDQLRELFPGRENPLVGTPIDPNQPEDYQGTNLPQGIGFQRPPEGMVRAMGPDGKMIFTTPEQANAMADRRFGTSPSAGGATAPVSPEATGGSAPAGQESRLDAMGLNMQSLRQLGRDAIAGPKAAYRYFTDPSQPSFGEVVKDVAQEQGTEPGFEMKGQSSAIPQGQPGSIQDNFVKRMATGEPLTQAETAAAIEFARSKGLNFDPRTGYSQAPMARGPQVMATAPRGMTMEFRDTNQDGIEDREQGIFRPGDSRGGPLGPAMFPSGLGANVPTLSSVNAMAGMAPQGRPALSAYEQASMDRQRRIGGTGSYAGDSAAREARIAARPDFNEAISDRDRRAARGEGLSQADARDLAQGSARGATEGQRARALQIQSRLGLGAFRPGTPRVDKLSQATSTVDRMIQNGQLSPDKRNAAIQRIVGLGDVGGAAGSAGAGVIGSAEFDRVASQLQPGGSLYEQGIRVDPSRVDPLTGAAQVYREKPGLEFGPPERLPVSPELMQQLLPYARSVRQGGTLTQDFTGMGMAVNQFAGSR